MSLYDSEYLELTYDAALKAYWRLKALKNFLITCGIKESFLAGNGEKETKRELLDRVFSSLRKHEDGATVIARVSQKLSEKIEFVDLHGWEDSGLKIQEAKVAVSRLKKHLQTIAKKHKEESEIANIRQKAANEKAEIQLRQNTLKKLEERFNALSLQLGQQQAGYDFQSWFYDLVDFHDISYRKPYMSDGRQIDGSITLEGTTYLIELKFTKDQACATDIDSLFRKVETKADNTMGIIVSVSGFSSIAVKEASKARTVLLLLDYNHLFATLRQTSSLDEIIFRVRRHASQTCEAYLPIEDVLN